ncbi:MAG TPA: carotenoid oxygenase family protein [Steroidobacteraceae bacterium]|nr:carotenoid oxygenase family protein [Steroidobacteraceae bacterium]
MSVNFRGDPYHTGFFAPMRFEADIHDCEVEGRIPDELDGSFYRTCVDRRYPQRLPNDIPYNADGMVDLFRFRKGHVDFRTRYIRTPRYVAERAARRALFGVYRNRYTDDPSVAGVSANTGNTTPLIHAGKLYCLKESSPPMLVDPHSLKTLGEYDFGGRLESHTFTAHPKIDPVSGEMIGFAYEARGELTDDVAVQFFDAQGRLTREVWIKAPLVSMMHDFAITQQHVILPTTAMVSSLERLKRGLNHWAYDRSVPAWVGILPRDGEAKDIRWFKGPHDRAMLIHATNARTEGNKVILDAPVARGNFNPQFPNLDGSAFDDEARRNTIRRWTFDLSKPDDAAWEEEILFPDVKPTSFSRMDDRYLTQPFRYSYNLLTDASLPYDESRGGNLKGKIANAWYRFDHHTQQVERFCAGTTHALHEAQFVPRRHDAPEGDGYLIGVANDFAEMKSELVIADARHLAEGPIARVKLPFRLHMQVHGWWASSRELPFDSEVDPDFIGGPYL